MIMFFSATGNSRYVATSLAEKLDDQVVDLGKRMHDGDTSPLHSQKPFVLCALIHVDGIPLPICRHVASTPLVGNRNAYAVVTMGSFAGIAGRQANKLFVSKNMTFKGWAEIAMPIRDQHGGRRARVDQEALHALYGLHAKLPQASDRVRRRIAEEIALQVFQVQPCPQGRFLRLQATVPSDLTVASQLDTLDIQASSHSTIFRRVTRQTHVEQCILQIERSA